MRRHAEKLAGYQKTCAVVPLFHMLSAWAAFKHLVPDDELKKKEEVRKAILPLKSRKATGANHIPAKFHKGVVSPLRLMLWTKL
jgi:hypothetical protein